VSGGLLISGVVVDVPGLEIINPVDGPSWCRLSPSDYTRRRTSWIRQIIVHGTRGGWPQRVLPGAGPGGREQVVASFWRGDREHSAAQIVVDTDGSIACLCDLGRDAAYHATVSNDWSIGIEMAQLGTGDVYQATIDATVRLIRALCSLPELTIPYQYAADRYAGRPIERMVDGGRDCVGVFGHRDNTSRRGRGDPGDAIFDELRRDGCEPIDFGWREDIQTWLPRQRRLAALGERLTIDGVAGPGTIRAMRRRGFVRGRELDAD
jgi:hypothetical protein